jgi:hypothetical protein
LALKKLKAKQASTNAAAVTGNGAAKRPASTSATTTTTPSYDSAPQRVAPSSKRRTGTLNTDEKSEKVGRNGFEIIFFTKRCYRSYGKIVDFWQFA